MNEKQETIADENNKRPVGNAAAHSFPKDYVLTGNRGEQVKQIGNSVPVMTAAAMCEADFKVA